VRFELPFLSYSKDGEVIAGSFVEHRFHRLSGFHNHKTCGPACGFREFLNEDVLHLLLHMGLRTSWAHNMEYCYLSPATAH
jgi:hypothetical protein